LPEKKESKEMHYDEHRRCLEEQHKAGRLLFSGPNIDGAYGIYTRLASSLEEAKRIAATDSHHERGIRTSGSARVESAPRLPHGQTRDR